MDRSGRHAARSIAAILFVAALATVLAWPVLQASSNGGPKGGHRDPRLSRGHSNLGGKLARSAPPPVTVHYFDQSVDLRAWTYCYGRVCADGFPPSQPPGVGDPNEVVVEFPLPGWSFKAIFTPTGEKCGRDQFAPLEATGDGEFVLGPAGHADTYDVTLFGRGDGDLFVTFRWTTPTDGPLPQPKARVAVLADHDGRVDSYGVELSLSNLASTPSKSAARITVTASDGDSLAFKAKQSRRECFPEGSVYWDRPDIKATRLQELGEGPFTYKVELNLDGIRYVATATWPDDQIPGNHPSVSLDFAPELPAPT